MDGPGPLNRLFQACLLLLASMVALDWAFGILRHLWPWLLGTAVIATTGYLVIWWCRRRSQW